MLPTTIHTAPLVGDFVPLSQYQSTTPESFHDGKKVLHYHATGAKVWLPKDQQPRVPIFPADAPTFEGDSGEMMAQVAVELFINSESLTMFNTKTSVGLEIPYPVIALHAMQHKTDPAADDAASNGEANKAPCVLLQLDLSDGGDDDETFDTIQLTLVPPATSTDLSSPAQEGSVVKTEQEKLFDAITACQNLHPDPVDEEDEEDEDDDYADRIVFESAVDGSAEGIEGLPGVFRGSATGDLPPPMPGSTGWITAENVGEYFDADGNWIGGGNDEAEEDGDELGAGAGRVRAREEINGHEANGDEGENKRPRTE